MWLRNPILKIWLNSLLENGIVIKNDLEVKSVLVENLTTVKSLIGIPRNVLRGQRSFFFFLFKIIMRAVLSLLRLHRQTSVSLVWWVLLSLWSLGGYIQACKRKNLLSARGFEHPAPESNWCLLELSAFPRAKQSLNQIKARYFKQNLIRGSKHTEFCRRVFCVF